MAFYEMKSKKMVWTYKKKKRNSKDLYKFMLNVVVQHPKKCRLWPPESAVVADFRLYLFINGLEPEEARYKDMGECYNGKIKF